jgi:hypothetical protein
MPLLAIQNPVEKQTLRLVNYGELIRAKAHIPFFFSSLSCLSILVNGLTAENLELKQRVSKTEQKLSELEKAVRDLMS